MALPARMNGCDEHLRPGTKFASVEGFVEQIGEDGRRARVILASEHWVDKGPTDTPFCPTKGRGVRLARGAGRGRRRFR